MCWHEMCAKKIDVNNFNTTSFENTINVLEHADEYLHVL